MTLIKRILLWLLVALILAYLALCWHFSGVILQTERPDKDILLINTAATERLDRHLDVVELDNALGESLNAWLFTPVTASPCVVVLAHGWGQTRLQVERFFRAFDRFGCAYVTFDHRAHGDRQSGPPGGGYLEKHDIVALSQWLRDTRGYAPEHIGFFGVSWGAATLLQAAASLPAHGFVVADSPFLNWQSAIFERGRRDYGDWVMCIEPGIRLGLRLRTGFWYSEADTAKHASEIQTPVLLIHSRTDTKTDHRQSVELAQSLPPERTRVLITDWGADHIGDFDLDEPRYTALVEDFILEFSDWEGFLAVPEESQPAP